MRSFVSIISLFVLAIFGGGSPASAFVSPFPATANVPAGIASTNDRSSPVVPSPLLHGNAYILLHQHVALKRQRQSVAPVQTMSLFGLGGPEIAVILIIGAFLLGPQKIAELGKQAGKTAGEFKGELSEVPKEFQKGLEEGETEARSKKAKPMEEVPSE